MDKFYEAFYDFMETQRATKEIVEKLEDVINVLMAIQTFYTSYNRTLVFLKNICFPEGTDDYTSNSFHHDYLDVVNSDKTIREFYDTYFKKGS